MKVSCLTQGAHLGHVDCGFVSEHAKMTGSYEPVAALIARATADENARIPFVIVHSGQSLSACQPSKFHKLIKTKRPSGIHQLLVDLCDICVQPKLSFPSAIAVADIHLLGKFCREISNGHCANSRDGEVKYKSDKPR